MSNQLKMADQTGILTLWRGGWSQRRIALELGVDRETVSRYIRLASAEANPANSTLGAGPSNPAISTPGNPGRQSLCQPLAEQIVGKLEQELTAKRIWQDLAAEHGFAGGYQSVKRFVRAMGASTPLPFRRMQEASGNGLTHGEFLELILQDELAVRKDRQIGRRTKAASFGEVKTLEDFDFSFNPSIKRKQLFDLASGQFIRDARDVLLVGPPGVGKSHLVQAIGYQAIKMGFVVFYRSIFDLVREFLGDQALGGEDKVLARYLKPDLLIIDDMGLKQLPKRSGECLFEIIMRRYENRSTMMTSNRPIEEWGKLIGDVPAATAILDRFLHHAEIIAITGKSYRLKDRACKPEKDAV